MRPGSFFALCALLALAPSTGRGADHPLDPLDRDEIAAATAVLRKAGKLPETARVVLLHLHEPPKAKVLAWRRGDPLPRQAFAVLYDWKRNATAEAVVDLDGRALLSWKDVPGVQPAILPDDDHARAADAVRADRGCREALARRGVRDLEKVGIFGYPVGAYAGGGDGHRRAFVVMFAREYGLIDDLTVVVDLTAKKVVKLEDRGAKEARKKRGDFAPIAEHDEPDGPAPAPSAPRRRRAFEVDGHAVRWGRWRFRFGLHPRVGLVLHTAGLEDGGKIRPVLYRACLSEMVVPYGDPNWILWCPFDAGEYGMGVYAKSSLSPGRDAPRRAAYFDAWLHDRRGRPVAVPRAAALYERDGGVLYRHGANARRARQLVLASFVRVDEYDYGFHWVFHEDGTLEAEVLLTGRMNVKPVEREEDEEDHDRRAAFGHLVGPRLEAPNHQHFFNFRLDLDVDGPTRNRVVELNTEALPEGPDNPHGNAFVMRETPLKTERAARRSMNLASNRTWKVVNTCLRNALGQPTGYVLIPGENSVPHAAEKSFVRRHAGFVNHHVWVTPYRPDEQYAAGDYVNGGAPGDGLPRWTQADRPIDDTDVVLWYTLGVTHVPRPEEWPLMPVHRAGFKLVPAGFFTRNPAMKPK